MPKTSAPEDVHDRLVEEAKRVSHAQEAIVGGLNSLMFDRCLLN